MPQVQDHSLDHSTCSPIRYHCAMANPLLHLNKPFISFQPGSVSKSTIMATKITNNLGYKYLLQHWKWLAGASRKYSGLPALVTANVLSCASSLVAHVPASITSATTDSVSYRKQSHAKGLSPRTRLEANTAEFYYCNRVLVILHLSCIYKHRYGSNISEHGIFNVRPLSHIHGLHDLQISRS